MVKLVPLLLLIYTFSVSATTYRASISKIDLPQNAEEEILLLLDDGNVIKLQDDTKELDTFVRLMRNRKVLRFDTDPERYLKHWKVIGENESQESFSEADTFNPTVLNSNEEAAKIFRGLRSGASSSSQCYNRAHVWAYESKNTHNLDSMKVFMFYTRKYIRQYNFGWWFHVAPFTYVRDNGNVIEKVLDYKFTRAPTDMKAWTDVFMKNKVECPVINKYSDYENHQEAQYCYLYKVSMYYLQPLDLDNLERTGKTKTQFIKYEVNRAYRNAFGWWW